jgi:uncharacterized membrane protein YfcA
MTPMMIVLGWVVIFFASLTSGLTGFGFALIAVPLLISFLPPNFVVPVVVLLTNLSHTLILIETRNWIDLKRIWPLILGGMAGVPLGTFVLLALDVDVLRVVMGFLVLGCAMALMVGRKRPVKKEKRALASIGVLSGLLSGSTGMGGPPAVLFFSNQGAEKQVFRANLTIFFTFLSIFTILSQLGSGLVTRDVLTYGVWLFPAALVGTWVGIKLTHRLNKETFQRVVVVVVGLSAVFAIASGLGLV